MINIYEPNISKYKNSAIDAIQSGWISNHGEFIENSSKKLKEILNVKHVILMANGTCATHCLFLALKYKYPHFSNHNADTNGPTRDSLTYFHSSSRSKTWTGLSRRSKLVNISPNKEI